MKKIIIILMLLCIVLYGIQETDFIHPVQKRTPNAEYEIEAPVENPQFNTYRDSILIFENFESGMPLDWTVIDENIDGITWTTGTTPDLLTYTPPNYETAYAYYSDDDAGSTAPMGTEYLISPAVNCAGIDNLMLSFGWGFRRFDIPYGAAWARFHDGISWNSWNQLAIYYVDSAAVDTFNLSTYLPADSVQIQFTYVDSTGGWAWAFGIDNVVLETFEPIACLWDFEDGWQGWTHTNDQSFPEAWDVQPSGLHPSWTPPDAGDSSLWIDSDATGPGIWVQDTALSRIIIPTYNTAWLKYALSYNWISLDEFLEVGIKYWDNSWVVVPLKTYTSDINPAEDSVDVSAYNTYPVMHIYFYYDDNNTQAQWAAIDNITIEAEFVTIDVGVVSIEVPGESLIPGVIIDPTAIYKNFGIHTEDFEAGFMIDSAGVPIYFYVVSLTLDPDMDTTIVFASWWAYPGVTYEIRTFTYLATDQNPSNDYLIWSPATGVYEQPATKEYIRFGFCTSLPNPMKDRAAIAYATTSTGKVNLKLYDASGKLVRTLVDAIEPPGIKRVFWDATDKYHRKAAQGIYFLRLEAENKVDIHKLILIR